MTFWRRTAWLVHRDGNYYEHAHFILTCLSNSLSSAAQYSAQLDDAEQVIRNLEQRWLENEDNPNALMTILADDFVHVLAMGFIGKEDQISYLRKHPQTSRGTKHFDE